MRLLDRRAHLAGDPPGVAGDRSAGLPLRACAGVGAPVEPSGGVALVDPSGAVGERLAQPGGVAAGVLDLVGRGRPVDAAVGHPAGRQSGAAAAPASGGTVAAAGGVFEHLLQVDVRVKLLELPLGRPLERLLERLAERPRRRRAFAGAAVLARGAGAIVHVLAVPVRLAVGWRRVGGSDDRAVLAGGAVERVQVAVVDPDDPGKQLVERGEVSVAEHLAPRGSDGVERRWCEDAVVGAGLQVHARAAGDVAGQRPAGGGCGEQLGGERGQDHVDHGCFERAADEPAADRGGRVLADPVGFHARLFEQPPVDRQLPVGRVGGLGQRDVVLDRPALGVLGVQRLVDRDAEAAQDRPLV